MKRRGALVMSALLMTSLLSGCGGGQADAEKTQEAAQTQAQGENQSQAEAGETAAVNPDATEVLDQFKRRYG